jgi:hypothetical protein
LLAYLSVDLNPVWDQIIYTPVHSLKETLLLEVMDYQNLTKDRSLGTVELKVSGLAQETMTGAGDSRFSFESTGKMDKSEPIRLDRGNQYKGQLHFLAEFLPAFALEGLKFETGVDELQAAVEGIEDGDDADDHSSSSSSSSSGEREARAITTTGPIGTRKDGSKNRQPRDATQAAESTEGSRSVSSREGSPPAQVGKKDGVKQKKEGIRMPKDELLTHRRWYLHLGTHFTNLDHRVRDHHLPRQVWRTYQEGPPGGPSRRRLLARLQHHPCRWPSCGVATRR